jgi:hypothetical protein
MPQPLIGGGPGRWRGHPRAQVIGHSPSGRAGFRYGPAKKPLACLGAGRQPCRVIELRELAPAGRRMWRDLRLAALAVAAVLWLAVAEDNEKAAV